MITLGLTVGTAIIAKNKLAGPIIKICAGYEYIILSWVVF